MEKIVNCSERREKKLIANFVAGNKNEKKLIANFVAGKEINCEFRGRGGEQK